MFCPFRVSHVIQSGDTLYQLAKTYHTTVPMIIALNRNVNPYNLPVGSTLTICPGADYWSNSNCTRPNPNKQIALINDMRLAWLQHVYWTRMLIISIIERLADEKDVTDRLLKNPYDIANIFTRFYPSDVRNTIANLLTEHLKIGADLVKALRDDNKEEAARFNRQWYQNEDEMADAFSSINPYYNKETVKEMLYRHLDLIKQEVSESLLKNYPADINTFDKIEQQALEMADYFSLGIMKEFLQMFC